MMRRNTEWNRLLKGLAIAISLISYSIAPVVGEEALDPFGGAARKGPDPREELRAEAALPDVDPDVALKAARPNMTLLGEKPLVVEPPPAPVSQAVAAQLRVDLEEAKADLEKTKVLIGKIIKENKQLADSRELPPLKDAEIKFFSLQFVKAVQAADTIGTLLGREPVRIAIDDRTNSLIVVGKAESLTIIEALLSRLDNEAQAESAPKAAAAAPLVNSEQRTLLLRVFWLANGVDDLDSADGYLPPGVIKSLGKLGLADPRLVTQTVNSLSAADGGGIVDFSSNVPAMLFQQPVSLTSSGMLSATTDGRAEVEMQLSVSGTGVSCEVKGSLTTPLEHYMVLGTANSLIPEQQTNDPMTTPEGMGGMPTGYGGRGGEMGRSMPMGRMPAAKYNASRFAFVVQVIEAESFESEGDGK